MRVLLMRKRAFTLIEILIVIGLLAGLSVSVLVGLRKYSETQALRTTTLTIASLLGRAQAQTFAREEGMQYGVYIGDTSAVLFSGTVYDSDAQSNTVRTFDSRVTALPMLAGGGDSVVFNLLEGDTDMYGTIVVYLVDDATQAYTITIAPTGNVRIDN